MSRSSLYPEQQLQRRALAWALRLKVNPEKVVIERLPGKWGSCAPNGVVKFATDLAAMNDGFQDYVIVHELLHLRYRDHGKFFKAMMTAHVPDWREVEQELSNATTTRTLENRAVRREGSGPSKDES
ncbi:M48 family metallopeptidase [Frigoribacterium sp. Leaf186]|uniref:M48 metallopeptidase family protein n=1 Tax=Frigoribacterium sp. Leaf186 TaxID=1736293 RepID=UPI0006FC0829|nr:M48 family metallopeptidase [Frigoribacterium sp. Leaf186]KQS22358.1 metal-dependent hydrolase [Frigoribacterium sp. Leaf186]